MISYDFQCYFNHMLYLDIETSGDGDLGISHFQRPDEFQGMLEITGDG